MDNNVDGQVVESAGQEREPAAQETGGAELGAGGRHRTGNDGARAGAAEPDQVDSAPAEKKDGEGGAAEGPADEGRAEEEAPPPPRQPTYVENLERRLVEAQDQLREYIQAFKKVKEENAEFRERLQREAEKELARLRGEVVSELFEVADNLDRSIAGAEAHWDADAFLAGIKMVRSQFLEKLEGLGLEVIAPAGQKFDPNEAEAIALVPTEDPGQDDTVIDVYARGYRMDGRVIRPAKVSVAKLGGDA